MLGTKEKFHVYYPFHDADACSNGKASQFN